MSLLWQPPLPLEEWTRLTTWVGVAVAGAIERTSGHRAAIKWPNDVQIEGRKAAGILIELGSAAATQAHFAVIGIGINANHELEDFPAELREIATSIRLARGETVDRPDFVVELIRELERWRPCLAGEGFGELVAEAARRSAILGRRIEAQTPEGLAEGIAESLDDDGCLVLRTAEGGRRKLVAGEVTLRRG
jgi:BirA family biotin operon repressor/biotin-[acetyl-CoA-carboxylase] ligase